MLKSTTQSIDGIGEAIKASATQAKNINITNTVQTAESVELTTKDFYRTFWHCRDFELNHLWQRSVFLSAFLFICFSAYGYLVLDMLEAVRTYTVNDNYLNIAHSVAISIACVGTVLSILWIMMAKGSKAWYEIYEAAIKAYESDDNFLTSATKKQKIGGFAYEALPQFNKEINDKRNDCIFNASAGAYSPSRINWAIGAVMLSIWIGIILIHFIIFACDLDESDCKWGLLIGGVAFIVVSYKVLRNTGSKAIKNIMK